jgi:hypothetical protein
MAVQSVAENFKSSGDNLAQKIQSLCKDFSARGIDASMAQDSGSVMVMVETPGKNPLLIKITPNPGRFDLSFWRDLSEGEQTALYDGVGTIRGDVDAVVKSVSELMRGNAFKPAERQAERSPA